MSDIGILGAKMDAMSENFRAMALNLKAVQDETAKNTTAVNGLGEKFNGHIKEEGTYREDIKNRQETACKKIDKAEKEGKDNLDRVEKESKHRMDGIETKQDNFEVALDTKVDKGDDKFDRKMKLVIGSIVLSSLLALSGWAAFFFK